MGCFLPSVADVFFSSRRRHTRFDCDWSSDVCSSDLDITPGTATQLAFAQQPSTTVAGVAISPAVQVTALDAAENPVPGFTGSVTIALGNNPGGSTLGGTTKIGRAHV